MQSPYDTLAVALLSFALFVALRAAILHVLVNRSGLNKRLGGPLSAAQAVAAVLVLDLILGACACAAYTTTAY